MAEIAASKKRRREPFNVDTKLVEIYEDLASEKDEIRLKAAEALISRFTGDKEPSNEDIGKTLNRLFRGLCSGRKAARIGFSIALTELLAQAFSSDRAASAEWSISRAIDVLESVSTPGGGTSGQEERDHHFGKLFGAEAIIKSGILFQPSAPLPEWSRVLLLIFDLAKKKPWLREECGWIVTRSMMELSAQTSNVKYVEEAVSRLCASDLARTPEGVAIWLAAKDAFPAAAFPQGTWQHDDPMHVREKATLAKVLKESSTSDGESSAEKNQALQSGVWNPKLHFAWDAILLRLYSQPLQEKKSNKSSKSARLAFPDFWTEVVDNGLFAASSSDERKYWGFLLFIKVVNDAPLEFASSVFTKNFMRCLMNQLAVEDRYLHRIAVKASKVIQTRVTKEPKFAAAAVHGLMGPAGSVNFDQITKTKTVDKIVTEADCQALAQIVPFFEALIAKPGAEEEKAAASSRQLIANLLLSIIRSRVAAATKGNVGEDFEQVMEKILNVFVRFAYFMDDGNAKDGRAAPEPQVTQATQELLRNRLMSGLSSLIAVRKNPSGLAYSVVRSIREMEQSGEYGKFIIEMADDIKESLEGAFKTLKKITQKETKKPDGESGAQPFKLLYSMTILQVYNGDTDAVSMLDELKFCYSNFRGSKKSKDEEAPEASDALVEILLSFASKQSQLFRRMSEQVFSAFADRVTADGLQSMIAVLETKESLAGQQEMFEEQEDEEDEDMMDVDDMDEDSDVEVVNGEEGPAESDGDENDDEEDDEEEGSSGSEDEGEEDDDDDELQVFDAKLAEALGTHRGDMDLNAESSDSDADMDDDEMEALDDALVKVFQARSKETVKKKDKKDAKETMVNFKNRVLDLLEIYVKRCHANPTALDLLLPLLRLARRSGVKQIAGRAQAVLREYTKQCKGTAGIPPIEDAGPVWAVLRDVHREAMYSAPPAHAGACSQASLLLVKTLVAHDRSAVGGVVDVYAESRKMQLVSKKCHIQPAFFTEWNNWCVQASKQFKE